MLDSRDDIYGDPYGPGQGSYEPPAQTPASDPPPKPGDSRLRPDGQWETWDGTQWVVDAAAPPPPPNNPVVPPTNTPPTGGESQDKPPTTPPDAGKRWVWVNNRWQQEWIGQTPGATNPDSTNSTISSVPGADGETATAFDWPGWESAGLFQPRDDTFEYTPFNYDPYTESSWEDAEKEPGYGASRNQLRKQIEAGAAHSGMLRSGMTIGDLYTGLDSLGQQNFANYDNRRFRNYSSNRDNAFGAWSANLGAAAQKFGLELGVDRDVYDRKATDVDRGNNYRYNVASSQFQDMLSRWQERVRSLTNIATAGANS